ncbi:hypothetical protein, conserved [Plasmodium gonderi]|uniref:Uncharacterized protein n=1 Tax=Plasmodium gonderi TaxID=77519 RepID=A0A1Y1JN80_PLAGO|nr:hypothetical protein, conserved [Plasmodium gonderi]GAW82998.1 hypothetical protein, conserved [Plasmodium gonderi]
MERPKLGEVNFQLDVGNSMKDADQDKLKLIASKVNGNYEDIKNESNLKDVLIGLNYHKKNVTNLSVLSQVKDATIDFVNSLKDDLTKYVVHEKNEFKEAYAKSIKLKGSKILGSYKNNMMLNNYTNIDIGFEYDLNTKLGKKCKYRNLPHYHNMFIILIKNFFLEKNFVHNLNAQNLSHTIDICISVNTWLNNSKSILVLSVHKKKKHIGSIQIILFPSKKLNTSLMNTYRKYYNLLSIEENRKIDEKTIRKDSMNVNLVKDKKKKNGSSTLFISNMDKSVKKNEPKIVQKDSATFDEGVSAQLDPSGKGEESDEDKLRQKIKTICTKRTILKKFILTECHLIECDHVIKRSISTFPGFKKAVKLLKLWCINKRMLQTFSTCDEKNFVKFKHGEKYKFGNIFYHMDINSFVLGLLCSYVCYMFELKMYDFFQIFKKTINFLSTMNLCEYMYEYQNGVFSNSKRSNNETTKSLLPSQEGLHIFLFNSNYDVFQSTFYSLTELIEEAKKADYALKCGNFYDLFASNIDCFSMNYEEELFFPFLVNNHFHNYNKILGNIRRNLIIGLADRLGEVAVRLASFDFYQIGGASQNGEASKIGEINPVRLGEGGAKERAEDDPLNQVNQVIQINKPNQMNQLNEELHTNSTNGTQQNNLTGKLFQDVLITCKRSDDKGKGELESGENGTEEKKRILAKRRITGVMFFLKTNNVMRYMDVSKNIFNPEGTSKFKQFWKDKVNIRRFENNTIFEVIMWKKPAKKLRRENLNKQMQEKTRSLGYNLRYGSDETEQIDNTGNAFFDALFSELYESRSKSVHSQAIRAILKMMKFKEETDLREALKKKIECLKMDENSHLCSGKRIKSKSFFVHLSSPLLVKDIHFSYYEKILDLYNDIKNILYSINEKIFNICNVSSSNELLKMTDLGYKKNNKKMIDIVVDIKFNNVNYKNAQNFFRIYEIAKGVIANRITKDGKSFATKVENKNFCIDVICKLVVFRLQIFFSKMVEKNLIQITNLDDLKIEHVEYMPKLRNCIFKPLISSFIYYYATKFSSFHLSVKICKLWCASKGICSYDELVENVLFYLYTQEFKKHAKKNYFYEQNHASPGSNNHQEKFLRLYRLHQKIVSAEIVEERMYYNSLCSRKKLTSKETSDGYGSDDYRTEDDEPLVSTTQQHKVTSDIKKVEPKGSYPNKNKKGTNSGQLTKSKKDDSSLFGSGRNDILAESDVLPYDADEFLDSFSICPKTALIKFLTFIVNHDWINKPLIIDYDNCLSEEHKVKLINSFYTRKKNKDEKKKFWICSLYDPHCILISLPHEMFELILNIAKNSLETIKNLHNNFERENWISLFLIEKRSYDIILNFHLPDKSCSMYKRKIKLINVKGNNGKPCSMELQAEDASEAVQGAAENAGSTTCSKKKADKKDEQLKKKQQKKEQQAKGQQKKEEEISEDVRENENISDGKKVSTENITNPLNQMHTMDEEYHLAYLDDATKKKKIKTIDMLKNLKKYELLLVYRTHFENFIKNVESKFSCQITVLYNPVCFNEIVDVHTFRKKIKRKLLKAHNPYEKVSMSWTPNVFITFNPSFIQNIQNQLTDHNTTSLPTASTTAVATSTCTGEPPSDSQMNPSKADSSSSLSLNNFNALIFYIRNNARDLLRAVQFPTV